jgi:hypothetical protein
MFFVGEEPAEMRYPVFLRAELRGWAFPPGLTRGRNLPSGMGYRRIRGTLDYLEKYVRKHIVLAALIDEPIAVHFVMYGYDIVYFPFKEGAFAFSDISDF